jgi:peptidoglycan/LPS O-acetylase OafA/YrhL
MTEIPSFRQHYPALDGLRGIAILLVVFYHNFGFINYFFFGWLGVDLFFVLSGFLITNILLNTVHNTNYLRNFFTRRILRIFPLYYAVLIICFFLIPAFGRSPIDLSFYTRNQLWFWFYLQNWLFIFKMPPENFLVHFWSLAVEEQFYLLWPFVILLVKGPKRLFLLVFGVLVLVLIVRLGLWLYHIEELSYFSLYTFTRIDGLCIGCMIALLQRISKNFLEKYTTVVVLVLAGINFIFYFINRSYQFSFPYLAIVGYTTFAIIFGFSVYEATTGKNKIIDTFFRIRLLTFFGKISYGLYIFHWPVYLLLSDPVRTFLNNVYRMNPGTLQFISSVVATGIAILISFLSYRYFEKYFLDLKPTLAKA